MIRQLMSRVSVYLTAVIALGATLTAQPAAAQMFEGIPAMNVSHRLPSTVPMSGALTSLYTHSAAVTRAATTTQPTVSRQRGLAFITQANKLYSDAVLKQKAGKAAEAIKLYGQVAYLRQNIWGENDPELAKIYSTLVGLYKKQGELHNAETCARRALSIAVKNGASLTEQRKSLVEVLESEKNYDEAYTIYHLVVECDKQTLGAENQIVVSEEVKLAQLAKDSGRTEGVQ